MTRIVFDNFSRGVVSDASRTKIGPEYTRGCSELSNAYIHKDNTIRRRPPLRTPDSPLATLRGLRDTKTNNSKIYALTDTQASEITELPTALQETLRLEGLLGAQNLNTLYQTVDKQLVGETTARLDTGSASVSLRAHVQKIRVFDANTKEELEEGYTLATIHHRIVTDYEKQKVSLTAKRAQLAGVLPRSFDITKVEEPAVAMIFRGTDKNAELLGSAHTVSFKRPDQSSPAIKNADVEDARIEFSPLLQASPNGQKEFVNTQPADITQPLDDLDIHPLGGVAFLFAGLFYRINNNSLTCENGPVLFPDITNMDYRTLGTFIEDNTISDELDLPVKVVYMPTENTPASGETSIYTEDNIKEALTTNLVTEVGQQGFNNLAGVEKLLTDQTIRGFSLNTFQQLFPTLYPVLKNLKKVIGYHQDPSTGANYMYPDVKFLVEDSDINGAGGVFPLYTEEGNTRAATVMSSAPRLNFAGQAFRTKEAGTTEFPNGGGVAAGGIGVTVGLFSSLQQSRNTETGAITQGNATTQVPTGLLYFYIDYSSPAAQAVFDGINIVSGFSSSDDRYHAAIMRKASGTQTQPAVAFEDILVNGMSTVGEDGSDAQSITRQGQSAPTGRRLLNLPFAPPLAEANNFGTHCYYVSATPGSAPYAHSWMLGTGPVSSVEGDPRAYATGQQLTRYLVRPTTYKPNTGRLYIVQARAAIAEDNKTHFSAVGELSQFSNPLARYWDSFVTATRSLNVLSASGIRGAVGTAPTDATTREFHDSRGGRSRVVTVSGESTNRIFIGTESSVYRVLPSSFLGTQAGGLVLDKISDYGVSSDFVSDSTYTVAAFEDQILVLRYYEEASGYTVDIINKETELQNMDTAVSMVGKHRLVLFHKSGTNIIYCMAVGSERQFKGFSTLTFPVAFTKIRAITQDVVGCQVVDGTYAELDFSADLTTQYLDSVNNKESKFETRLATLPLLIVDKKVASPDFTTIPRNITLGLHGYMNFKISVVDDDTNQVSTTDIRLADKRNIEETRVFSGLYTHKGLGQTASTSPRIRISKDDDKYLSLSSAIVTVR